MRVFAGGLFAVLLFIASAAAAGEAFDPAARAKLVAPFIDEAALAVLHADVSRVEIGPVIGLLGKLLPDEDESELSSNLKEVEGVRGAFLRAGGKEIYVVINAIDLPEVLVLIPLAAGADEKALAAMFPFPYTAERRGNLLLMCSPEMLARLRTVEPDARPELTQAFEAAGDTTAQAVLIPPKYAARVIEELVGNLGELAPDLPPEIGNTPGTVISQGIAWAALGADVEPKVAVRLVVQSRDEAAAKALHQTLVGSLEFVGKQPDVRKMLPTFDKVAAALTPKLQGDRLTVALDEDNDAIDDVVSSLVQPVEEARATARRVQSINQMKQIGVGMHMFVDNFGSLPAPATYDAAGKPLLSWRVHILRFLDQEELYKQFHLDEPWDSQHNRTLIEKMPDLYRAPTAKTEPGHTVYLVPVGEETAFPGREGIPMSEIRDTARTILVVEADDAHAVVWTKPEDLPFDPANPAKGLDGPGREGFSAVFADGHVEFARLPSDANRLRTQFTRAAEGQK